jgi:predicted P-loop ATPase
MAEGIEQLNEARKKRTVGKAKEKQQPNGEGALWANELLCDGKGKPYQNFANVMIALRMDPAFVGALEFNEMAQDAILLRNVPLVSDKPAPDCPRPITDDDVSRFQDWLQHHGLPRIGHITCGQAMHMRAMEFRRHPVREWLQSLQWDQTERLSGWLQTYLGATADNVEYLVAIGRMCLIAMVARIFEPGCQADYMLVLEGPQGTEKSRACRALAGKYFSDSLPENISSKDARQHLRGKWLIEIAELAAFTKAEIEPLKAFITRTHERYRPPYNRNDIEEARQCLFIGTTNKPVYIKDETGGRRFWPVKCGRINVAALEDDREQLFAEAVDRYLTGEQWWPDAGFEITHIKPQQEQRTESDPWEGTICKYVDGELERQEKDLHGNVYSAGKWPRTDRVTVTQVAKEALGFDTVGRVGTADQRRIASVLDGLGWTSGRDWHGRFYKRGL